MKLPLLLLRLWDLNHGKRGDEYPMELPESSMVDDAVTIRVYNGNAKKFDAECLFIASFLDDDKENTYYSIAYYLIDGTPLDLSYCAAINFSEMKLSLASSPGTIPHSVTCKSEESIDYETFTGIENMGFIWSMKTIPGCRFGMRYGHKDVTKPMKIRVMAGRCYRNGDSITYEYLNSKINNRWYFRSDNTTRTMVETKTGVVGTLFTPKEPGVYPAIIDMFGTAGGILEFRAALLSSHGFICLALPYFDYKDLPESFWGLKLEYFENAIDWILSLPNVDSRCGIGVSGVSYGGELALTLGSYFPDRVKAIVAISSSDITTNMDISYRGEKIPSSTPNYSAMKSVLFEDKRGDFLPSTVGNNIHPIIDGFQTTAALLGDSVSEETKKARIQVEKMNAALLLLSGRNDVNWPAAEFSRQVMDRLDSNRYPYPYNHNCYEKTGHLIEPPYSPFCPMSYHKLLSGSILWGGEGSPQNRAHEHSWQNIIDFFRFSLSSSRL